MVEIWNTQYLNTQGQVGGGVKGGGRERGEWVGGKEEGAEQSLNKTCKSTC